MKIQNRIIAQYAFRSAGHSQHHCTLSFPTNSTNSHTHLPIISGTLIKSLSPLKHLNCKQSTHSTLSLFGTIKTLLEILQALQTVKYINLFITN